MEKNVKIGLIHDWLVSMRGGEKVFEVFCELFPGATVGTLVHRKGGVSEIIENHQIKTSFLQNFPLAKERYQYYLPLFPTAIENLDFSDYDVLISSSHAVAKGIKERKDVLHICYCHTPMRYIWDQYENYFGKNRSSLPVRAAMKFSLSYLRWWDIESSKRVTHFIANSENVRRRIFRIYGRDSDVIHPPVDTDRFKLSLKDDGYYLIVSALVPYKRIDIAVEAFNVLGEKLVIVGTGSEEKKLKTIARRNVEFVGQVKNEVVNELYSGCRALIFTPEEDFGIVPLEAMATGKPVVAYGSGGALETVVDRVTGLFYHNQSIESLIDAVKVFQKLKFNPEVIRNHALQFDRAIFKQKIKSYIDKKWEE